MAHFAGLGLIFAPGEHADKDKMWTWASLVGAFEDLTLGFCFCFCFHETTTVTNPHPFGEMPTTYTYTPFHLKVSK